MANRIAHHGQHRHLPLPSPAGAAPHETALPSGGRLEPTPFAPPDAWLSAPAPDRMTCFIKGGERFIIFYLDGRENEVCDQLGRWAASPEMAISWYDAAMISQHVRTKAIEYRQIKESKESQKSNESGDCHGC